LLYNIPSPSQTAFGLGPVFTRDEYDEFEANLSLFVSEGMRSKRGLTNVVSGSKPSLSSANIETPSPICRMFELHTTRRAVSFTTASEGSMIATRTPITKIVISTSISENARRPTGRPAPLTELAHDARMSISPIGQTRACPLNHKFMGNPLFAQQGETRVPPEFFRPPARFRPKIFRTRISPPEAGVPVC